MKKSYSSIPALLLSLLLFFNVFQLEKQQADEYRFAAIIKQQMVASLSVAIEKQQADDEKQQAIDSLCVPELLTDMRIEVNIRERKLYVYDGETMHAMHPVAVGRPQWPTRTGNWKIHTVAWNPWWHPPNEKWARNRLIKAPGDRDNPMGRAQLIYDAPRSIHGTNEPASIGRAVSHGSIRVHNETAMNLARQAMESGGAERDEQWYEEVRFNRGKNVRVTLANPIPIRVYSGW